DPPPALGRPRRLEQQRAGRVGRGGRSTIAGRRAGDRADDPRGPGRDRLAGGSPVERSLGLMAGAGTRPGPAAEEAKRRGWRVAAFAFEEAAGLAEAADVLIPSTITDIQAVLGGLAAQRGEGAGFGGGVWE